MNAIDKPSLPNPVQNEIPVAESGFAVQEVDFETEMALALALSVEEKSYTM